MGRNITIILINLGVGLVTAYFILMYVRETNISASQDNIACEIIKLDMVRTSRHHPSADIIYQGKEYNTNIGKNDSLQLGFNDTTFYYDEKLDRVFCRDPGIGRGAVCMVVIFFLSFLLWFEPQSGANKRRRNKKH